MSYNDMSLGECVLIHEYNSEPNIIESLKVQMKPVSKTKVGVTIIHQD